MKKSSKFVKIFLILTAALVVSSCITLLVVQNDKQVKLFVEQQLNSFFSTAFECQFHTRINQVNLLGGTIELTDLAAVPATGAIERWSWQAQRATISFSWLDLLVHQTFFLTIELFDVHAYSRWDNGLALYEHILVYTKTPPVKPFLLEKFVINNSVCEFVDIKNNNNCCLEARLVMNCTPYDTRTALTIYDGFFIHNNKKIVEHCTGILKQPNNNNIESKITFELISTNAQAQTITALMQYSNDLSLNFYTDDRACQGTLVLDANNHAQFSSEVSLACIKNFLVPELSLPIEGNCTVSGDLYMHDIFVGSGNCTIDTISCAGIEIPMFKAQWSLKDSVVSTKMLIGDKLHSTGVWDILHKRGSCTGVTTQELTTPWGVVPANTAQFLTQINGDQLECSGNISGTFITATHQKNNLRGDFTITPNQSSLKVQLAEKKLQLTSKKFRDSMLTYHDGDKKLFSCTSSFGINSIKFSSSIDYLLVQKILQEKKIDLPGSGIIQVTGEYDYANVHGTLELCNAHIKLPNTYNLIKNIQTKFEITGDANKLQTILHDTKVELNKGEIISSDSTINAEYKNKNFVITTLYCPFILTDCFVGLNNDLFTLINGAGLLYYNGDKTDIKAQVVVNQTHMSTNIFSSEFMSANQFMGGDIKTNKNNILLDVLLQTKSPIHVKTPFLDISGHINCALTGSTTEPQVRGTLDLVKGRLEFPYQPLFITRGKLSFNTREPDNPRIELVARNTIKKYNVTMTINGTLQEPTINFSSSPNLDETTIISLLLGGVDDGSLSLVMPQIVMGSVRNLIFGSTQNSSTLLNSLNRVVKPFKNIRLVPGFSDDTGRGGVRGSLMIEFDERLRAKIEQNFSLPEDVKIEVEYAISDDTTIRALRDERGDTGAEVEMRWKF